MVVKHGWWFSIGYRCYGYADPGNNQMIYHLLLPEHTPPKNYSPQIILTGGFRQNVHFWPPAKTQISEAGYNPHTLSNKYKMYTQYPQTRVIGIVNLAIRQFAFFNGCQLSSIRLSTLLDQRSSGQIRTQQVACCSSSWSYSNRPSWCASLAAAPYAMLVIYRDGRLVREWNPIGTAKTLTGWWFGCHFLFSH